MLTQLVQAVTKVTQSLKSMLQRSMMFQLAPNLAFHLS